MACIDVSTGCYKEKAIPNTHPRIYNLAASRRKEGIESRWWLFSYRSEFKFR